MKIRTLRPVVNAKRRLNPLRADPTRTAGIRRQISAELRKAFARIKAAIVEMVLTRDVFGLEPPVSLFAMNKEPVDLDALAAEINQKISTGSADSAAIRAALERLTRAQVEEVMAKSGTQGFLPFGKTKAEVIDRFIDQLSSFSRAATHKEEIIAVTGGKGLPPPPPQPVPIAPPLPPAPPPAIIAPAGGAGQWRFKSTPEKVDEFRRWLRRLLKSELTGKTEEELWAKFTERGFKQGGARAFDDARRTERAIAAGQEKLDFYAGTKDEFLRSAFGRPVAVEKVKLLAGRAFDEMEGVTDRMARQMTKTLATGLVQGKGPREVARELAGEIDISRGRAEMIARTELIRAHAEGQLEALEQLGVEELGVEVEWSTSGLGITAKGNPSPCQKCAAMAGRVFSIKDASGLIPFHPNCMCSFIPHLPDMKATSKRALAR